MVTMCHHVCLRSHAVRRLVLPLATSLPITDRFNSSKLGINTHAAYAGTCHAATNRVTHPVGQTPVPSPSLLQLLLLLVAQVFDQIYRGRHTGVVL
jgi:hypothetical protein